MFDQNLVFLDLETTGGSVGYDRIIEIGVVEIANGERVAEWSTLVNPGRRVPHSIQVLTGITEEDLRAAPAFAEIAPALLERLRGKVFAAHNARFDYGFLKTEFARAGLTFEAPVLCTVKLSRRLAPQHDKHNLDALIVRNGLFCLDRHRALGDARVLWDLAQIWRREIDPATLAAACADLMKRPAVPAGLPPDLYDTLPETAGVYTLYGDDGRSLYVGAAANIRSRVLVQFTGERRSGKDLRLTADVRRVDWNETTGELSAHFEAARLVAQLQPAHNRLAADETCSWYWRSDTPEIPPRLIGTNGIDDVEPEHLYGAFRARSGARNAMRELARTYSLCHKLVGLEPPGAGPCSAHTAGRCRGACVGKEPAVSHAMRTIQALSRLRIKPWPYPGPIAIRERHVWSERTETHVFDRWRYLGTAHGEDEVAEIVRERGAARFDLDTYRALQRLLKSPPRNCQIVALAA
ncbi:MAG TPA: exonuclease domain-containing protein [Burkholderiales bacterium]|nr:exonuclease domain-containing protein [Burkholderiales bacterium]